VRDAIRVGRRGAQAQRELPQQLIACGTAQRGIDVAEAVDVDEQQRDAHTPSIGLRRENLRSDAERGVVGAPAC
jgi:hypothetical protein